MIQYYAVVYCHDGTIHLWPGNDQSDCINKLKEMKGTPKIKDKMKATTVIKRDMSNFKEDMIFGNPKSLNVMASK